MKLNEVVQAMLADPKLAAQVWDAFPPVILPWTGRGWYWSRVCTMDDQLTPSAKVTGKDGESWSWEVFKLPNGVVAHGSCASAQEAFTQASNTLRKVTGCASAGPDVPNMKPVEPVQIEYPGGLSTWIEQPEFDRWRFEYARRYGILTDEVRPTFCPFCGSRDHVRELEVTWPSFSMEDPENKAELNEFQCHSDTCQGRSFWA